MSLTDDVYSLILKSIPYIFPSMDLSPLQKNKVQLLIENKILVFNAENYNSIKKFIFRLIYSIP